MVVVNIDKMVDFFPIIGNRAQHPLAFHSVKDVLETSVFLLLEIYKEGGKNVRREGRKGET